LLLGRRPLARSDEKSLPTLTAARRTCYLLFTASQNVGGIGRNIFLSWSCVMRKHALLVLAVGLLIAADNSKEDGKMKEEVEKLQGTWNFTSLEVQGMKFPEKAFAGSQIVIKGNSFTTLSGEATYKGTFKVDITKQPKTLDLNFTEGPEKGNTSLAIYELEGDNWKICLTVTGKDRPKEFASKPGSGHALETLKREKAK
jgi:uncharacterized protein (TIGR03067 family)